MKIDELLPGPSIRWTDVPNQIDNGPANAALLDYIDAAIRAAFDDRAGVFKSREAYEEHKLTLRKAFNDKLLQLAGAK